MSNYTPIDISLLLRDGGVGSMFEGNKKSGFDKVFFPFSITVLIMSLSFYAVKLIIDITNPANKVLIEPSQAPRAVITQFIPSPSATPIPAQVYQEVDGILIDKDRVTATAEAQYPNISNPQLVDLVNKSLIEWAALRNYYKDKPEVMSKLSLDVSYPVATFGAVLRDLGVMTTEHDTNTSEGQMSISSIIDSFIANSKMR